MERNSLVPRNIYNVKNWIYSVHNFADIEENRVVLKNFL